jgi:hypothetical protein
LAQLKIKIETMFFSVDYLTKNLHSKISKQIESYRDELNKSMHDYSFATTDYSHSLTDNSENLNKREDEKILAKNSWDNTKIIQPSKRRSRSRSPLQEINRNKTDDSKTITVKKRFKSSITKRAVDSSLER